MVSQPHLEPINPVASTYDKQLRFTFFSTLPTELRFKIWRYALHRQRLFHIYINNQKGKTASEAGENPDCVINGERYFTIVKGSQLLSKLLSVNKESREEALKFQRVHLPCRFVKRAVKEEARSHGTLHLNPELDFLHISAEWPAKDTLIPFLYRLKTIYDPRHAGLLNLVIEGNDLTGNDIYSVDPSDVDPELRSAFVETLAQLWEVWFFSHLLVGRQMVGPLCDFNISGSILNRSFPILTTVPTFERFPRDPRPIIQDLENTIGLSSSRDALDHWLPLLKIWQVSPYGTSYRFLLAFNPRLTRGYISDRTSANEWLQAEEDRWNGLGPPDTFLENSDYKWPVRAQDEKYRNEDLGKSVRPAFGFWLFPLDALARTDGNGLLVDEGPRLDSKGFKNMKAHWPELALSSLS